MCDRPGTPERAYFLAACLIGTTLITGCGAKADTPKHLGYLFRSSGNPLQFVNVPTSRDNVAGFLGSGDPELSPGGLPGDWGVYTIPTHSGANVIRFAGNAGAGDARCDMKAYSTHIRIDDDTKLSYWIYPQQDNGRFVGVDLHCTDGTTLSSTSAVDQHGASMNPTSGHGDEVTVRTWSEITCAVGKWLGGKTVDAITVLYHRPNGGGQYRGYIDDIVIGNQEPPTRSQIVSSSAPARPSWVKNAVIYAINTRQFSPEGTLNGIVPQLDRLHKLGATVIWLLPINAIGEKKAFGSPYCIKDYNSINPRYGTDGDLHKLVDAVHKRGMKIIIDLPLNHTAWDNPLIDQHPDWYRHDDGNKMNPATISRTPDWSDVAQLDYSNPALRSYMIDVQKHWLTTYGIDGFRFDAAEMIPTEFWNESAEALKAVKPEIFLLGESHRPETMMKAFDADYSFTTYPQIVSILQGHETASSLRSVLEYEKYQFPRNTLHMRYPGNQDTDKPAKLFGREGALAAALLSFTLDGVPMIYNGYEVGDAAPGNFIDAPPIDWSKGDAGVASFYTDLAALRRKYPALVDGDTQWVGNSDPDHVAVYARSNGKQTVLIAVNLSATPTHASIALKKGQTIEDITPAASTATTASKSVKTPLVIDMAPYGFHVYACRGAIDHVVETIVR